MHSNNSKEQLEKMTGWPMPKLIFSMSAPTVISMLTTSLYNMADTYFVSQLGTSVSAAVGIAFSLMALIQMVGFSLGMGAGSLISRYLGHEDNAQAGICLSSAFAASLLCGTAIALWGLRQLAPLMLLLGSTQTILPYACQYSRFILFSAPLFCASFVLNNALRYQGKSTLSMIGLTAGGVLNILLDPLLINICHLGIAGAAVATMASQIISFILILYFIQSPYSILHLRLKDISCRPSVYWSIVKNGLPTACRQGIASFASALLNNQAAAFGDAVVAAISIANRIYMFVRNIIIGIGQGFQPVAGYNYGAGQLQRVKKAFWVSAALGSSICAVCALLIYWQAPGLMILFRKDDPQVISVGTQGLHYLAMVLPLLAYSTFVNQLLQCLGRTLSASFLASCRQGIFFIPLVLYLPQLLSVQGLLLTQPLADLATFLISIPFHLWFFHSRHGLGSS